MARLIFFTLAVQSAGFLSSLVRAHSSPDSAFGRIFDYVVVGGGTAGLVVASRLSEDPYTTVAVIEAGVHHINEPLVDTPEFFSRALGNPAFDWEFVTTPQAALNNMVLKQPRGKMLGGSSGLNFVVWDRASKKEYDAWETLGALGWNWNSLLPYFKKSETIAPQLVADVFPNASVVPDASFDMFHGRAGPVQPSYNVIYSTVTDPYVQTVNSLGVPTSSDPYSGDATGIYNTEVAIDRVKNIGRRSYSASTYFNISADRPNLTVFQTTQAVKINFGRDFSPFDFFSGSSNVRAESVDVIAVNTTGVTGTIWARKEVILSAGAFGTPQLLELSGVGNRTILKQAGIETVVDLPGVGENFQDHPSFTQDFQVDNSLLTFDILRNNATFMTEQQTLFDTEGTGMLAAAQFVLTFSPLKDVLSAELLAQVQANAAKLVVDPSVSPFTRLQHQISLGFQSADDVGNIEIIMFPGGGRTPVPPEPGLSYITVYACLMHPFARGSVHINTADPFASPLINPNYLNNDVDKQLALEGVKLARKITQSQPLAPLIVADHVPLSNVTTDEDWLDFAMRGLTTTYHPVGTAAMVPRELGGVVNPLTLKVYGTSNVRVVDASLMPMLIATHPQSTVYAMAERASDMIKGRFFVN